MQKLSKRGQIILVIVIVIPLLAIFSIAIISIFFDKNLTLTKISLALSTVLALIFGFVAILPTVVEWIRKSKEPRSKLRSISPIAKVVQYHDPCLDSECNS